MIQPVYVIGPFDAVAAGTLLVITFFWGYIVCWDSPLGQGRRPRDAPRQGCVMAFCAL